MQITKYRITSNKICGKLKIACVSDLHARPCKHIIDALKIMKPDMILLAGDIMEISTDYMKNRNSHALMFFENAARIAPVYYCFGNHEIYYSHAKFGKSKTSDRDLHERYMQRIREFGIHVINDSFCEAEMNTSGGITVNVGGIVCGNDKLPDFSSPVPNLDFLKTYDECPGFNILLCHYPHYYEPYLKNTNFDLIVAGHAHGGHWRFFGHGVYSPHQGLFPKYTSGIYDNRFIINKGAVNNSKPIPRFFNPTEILEITVLEENI